MGQPGLDTEGPTGYEGERILVHPVKTNSYQQQYKYL